MFYEYLFVPPPPYRITRAEMCSQITCDLRTILKRFGIYSYWTPGRHIDPRSDEGLRICERIGFPPSQRLAV